MDAIQQSIVRACYAGLDSVTLRRRIADRVLSTMGVDAHAFSTADPATGLHTHTVSSGIPSALHATFIRDLYPTEVAPLVTEMMGKGRTVFSVPDHSPVVRDEMAAYGIRDQLYVLIAEGGRRWGAWCVMRASASAKARVRREGFLRALVPHLAHGLRAAARLEAARNAAAEDVTAPGTLVLDHRERIVLRTPAVAAALADLADVVDAQAGDPPLPIAVRAVVGRLHAMRGRVAATAEVRSRSRSGRWYLLQAARAEPDADGRCATVVSIRPAGRHEVAPFVTALYDLSPREREVVGAVVRGESTKTIAAALRISVHTVTEHIDRACRKAGVRGRKALLARLLADGYAPSR